MKLINNFILILLITPVIGLTSCRYEDTETVSPEASLDAIGAYFEANSNSIKVRPGAGSFEIALNRANANDAVSIDVETLSNDKLDNDVDFCTLPTAFSFNDGEYTTSYDVTYNAECVFQQSYSFTLQIMDGAKDHPYAAGYTSTEYTMTLDYDWEKHSSVFTETEEGEDKLSSEPYQITVQRATNYYTEEELETVGKNNQKDFIYVPAVYGGEAGFQFFLDTGTHLNTELLSRTNVLANNIYGIPVKVKKGTGIEKGDNEIYLMVKSVSSEKVGEDTLDEENNTMTCIRKITVVSTLYDGDTENVYADNSKTVFTLTFVDKIEE